MDKLILMPGMDGTGNLFAALANELPHLDVDIVKLNNAQPSLYARQTIDQAPYDVEFEYLSQLIGDERVTLIAESYSGLLAYRLCQAMPEQIRQVVFIASFVSVPSRWAYLAAAIPSQLINPSLVPQWLLDKFCFAGFGQPQHVSALVDSIAEVDKRLLSARLKSIAGLPRVQPSVQTPALYIRPKNDYLVSRSALKHMANVFPKLTIKYLAGGHFIAQTHPSECAAIISQVI